MIIREPSIHITRSELIKILKKLMPEGVKVIPMTDQILRWARPLSLNNRMVIASTDKLEHKATRTLASPTVDANIMARVIFMVRKKMKHVGVVQIKPASRDWAQVKAITAGANEFCIDYDLTKKQGYIEYLQIAFSKMVKPSLQKIPTMHTAICETYAAMKEIQDDPYPDSTLKIHEYYRMKVATKTGLVNNFKGFPDKYVWFVRAGALMKTLGVSMNIYLDAQFEAMDYRGALPDPSQLVGQKAKERLNKYLFEHKIDLRKHGNNQRH
jgi:hypothetical protein